MTKEEFKKNVRILTFNEAYQAPVMKYNKAGGFINWGRKNEYPEFILDVYNTNGSPIHKSIINKKVKLASGKGLKKPDSEELSNFIKNNKLNKEIKKAFLDYELFNGFAFEIIKTRGGDKIASIKHIPLHKLRLGIECEEIPFEHFLFSNKWKEYKKEMYIPEVIPSYDVNSNEPKQIFYYSEYNPQSDGLYPIISYSTTMNWIELHYEISKFHLNQVKQGYAPSFILNFATGIPTDEEQDMFYKEFNKKYSGSENAGKIILAFSEGKDDAPTFEKIELNDSDERFTMLVDQIENNIVQGAEIPPQLVLLQPGKLGSTEERTELLSEFNDSYIESRQEVMEEVVNEILGDFGFTEEVELNSAIEESEEETVDAVDKEAEARAALKGSVGGVQGILSIQQSVAQGLTSLDSGAAILELIYGLGPLEAKRMLGEPQVQEEVEPKQNEE